MAQVGLISNKNNNDVAIGMLTQFREPSLDVIETGFVGDIID
jgi:hypothetical protein